MKENYYYHYNYYYYYYYYDYDKRIHMYVISIMSILTLLLYTGAYLPMCIYKGIINLTLI